ncbi:P-loop containing nucleoside triphosphate hydrolase protein [Pluteus cervinus]|uniref:P-loop containing nucleoside triphosphate hydrolase protein n=1 Tax=Pluteus cervinus TaxID=181527 RepID=A0ACD3BG89_9AGAR|nr:P-loop containing nucleoside triphosphate hydrolase protein [Pluteus cervinus]
MAELKFEHNPGFELGLSDPDRFRPWASDFQLTPGPTGGQSVYVSFQVRSRVIFTVIFYLRIWWDTLMIPTYFASFSMLVLLNHGIVSSRPYRSLRAKLSGVEALEGEDSINDTALTTATSISSKIRLLVAHHGGAVTTAYKILRLLGCLALLCLSIFTVTRNGIYPSSGSEPVLTTEEALAVAMCIFYFYALLLGTISISATSKWGRRSWNHLSVLLLVTFAVYSCRDIFPLATYTMAPLDLHEGWVLWPKVTVLSIISIIIPLAIPQQYIPIDPKYSTDIPSPEQTASFLSRITYSYASTFIWSSRKKEKITQSDLPPLCDYDRASYLRDRSFPVLDTFSGAKRRHLFFGLIRVFGWEYTSMGLAILAQVLVSFCAPVSLNQILKYVETGGEAAYTRPWFWILLLLLGPIAHACAYQWCNYVATCVLIRAEGIITQLVFEHALRTRVKAEATTPVKPEQVAAIPEALDVPELVSAHGADQGTPIEGPVRLREETLHNGPNPPQGTASSPQTTKRPDTQKRAHKFVENPSKQPAASRSSEDKAEDFIGRLNNLVTADMGNITGARDLLTAVIQVPVQGTLCILFLYAVLGWSAFVGLATTLMLYPLPGYLANKVQAMQAVRLKKADARIQTVTESMNIIRMVKLFGWERKMSDRLADIREEELLCIQKRNILKAVNSAVNFLIPIATMIATYTTYTVIMNEELSPSKVFSSMAVFDMLRRLLWRIFFVVMDLLSGKVSLDRLTDFLQNTELLDAYSEKPSRSHNGHNAHLAQDQIGFKDASFAWTSENTDRTFGSSKRDFRLRIDAGLTFKKGCINLILGPAGSGKTSLLMALLGEMHFIPTGPQSWFHLPREGGVAYVPQGSWVQNETVRDNIVFNSPFDETRYQKVLYQCALEQDFRLFHAGDRTEVGERGLALNGGQKARITLARAIYSQAKIILLDDILAALERVPSYLPFPFVHTAKWVVDKCFSGDLVEGRTVLLVTHNVAMMHKIADFAVTLDIDGRVTDSGPISDTRAIIPSLEDELEEELAVLHNLDRGCRWASPAVQDPSASGKLIAEEEVEVGRVSWKTFKVFLKALGGNFSLLYFVSFIGIYVVVEMALALQTWYLGFWASQYQDHHSVDTFYYVDLALGIILLSCISLNAAGYLIFVDGQMRASRTIHRRLMDAILGTTLRWLDRTPISRVIARCTQDIRSLDEPLSQQFHALIEFTVAIIVKLAAILLFTPVFIIPTLIIGVLGSWLGQIYIAAQLPIKWELSNAKAPVLAHVGAAIAGIVSIRAYSAEERFLNESLTRIDRYIRAQRIFFDFNRWITIRIDTMGSVLTAGLAAWLIYGQNNTATNTGFSLHMAIGLSGSILWSIRLLNIVEVEGNSLERIGRYLQADQEPKPTLQGVPPAYWPIGGELRVAKLCARYSPEGPEVLHDLSFTVEAGQHIGIVGRPGSGKSTLTLSLLRSIYTEGAVYYDGIDTSTINLDALRSKITVIPQIPELMSGSLRYNLDPFEQFEDAELNDALRAAGLSSLQNDWHGNRLTLDSAIASGGGNLSVGQRQVFALARAIVRGSKLLIMDEATSAIDYKTDAVIQSTLRNELRYVTLITIAHRLRTIMDADKILVLDAGRIVEFDSPKNLLANEKGALRALVDQSADRKMLYAMAGAKE